MLGRTAQPSVRAIALGLALAGAATLCALAISPPRAAAAACPNFQVLHNDRIGPAVLPKGTYEIKVLASDLSCQAASKRFTDFLQDYDGKLPAPWAVVAKGTGVAVFTRSGQAAFRARRISSTGGGAAGGQKAGACPGSFQVQNNDRIGPLRFPKGRYRLIIPPGSIITCDQAAKLFRQFLARPAGNLPKNWSMKRTTALLFKPANPMRKKFRVDPWL